MDIISLRFHFKNGQKVDIDPLEFGGDCIGTVLDDLAMKHGGVAKVEATQAPPKS